MSDNYEDRIVSEYLLVRTEALPEIYNKVMLVKELLQTGEVRSVNEAVQKIGISRSAYYKYRDDVQVWNDPFERKIVTILTNYNVDSDALAELILDLSNEGAKLLNISQGLPQQGVVDLVMSVDLEEVSLDLVALRRRLSRIPGIRNIEIWRASERRR